MEEIYLKLIKLLLLVLMKNLILMESFVFLVIYHCIGVYQQIFAKNVIIISLSIWILEHVKRLLNMNSQYYKTQSGYL